MYRCMTGLFCSICLAQRKAKLHFYWRASPRPIKIDSFPCFLLVVFSRAPLNGFLNHIYVRAFEKALIFVIIMFQAFASHMTTETQKQLELHRMQQEQLKRQQEHIMHQQHKIQELQVSGSCGESVLFQFEKLSEV
jgi:hypothetical protein